MIYTKESILKAINKQLTFYRNVNNDKIINIEYDDIGNIDLCAICRLSISNPYDVGPASCKNCIISNPLVGICTIMKTYPKDIVNSKNGLIRRSAATMKFLVKRRIRFYMKLRKAVNEVKSTTMNSEDVSSVAWKLDEHIYRTYTTGKDKISQYQLNE